MARVLVTLALAAGLVLASVPSASAAPPQDPSTSTKQALQEWFRRLALEPSDIAAELQPYSDLEPFALDLKVFGIYRDACVKGTTAGEISQRLEEAMPNPTLDALAIVSDAVAVVRNRCPQSPQPFLDAIASLLGAYVVDASPAPVTLPAIRPQPQTNPLPKLVVKAACKVAGAEVKASKWYEELKQGRAKLLGVGLVTAAFFACPTVLGTALGL
jgi:hypothetical protein